MRWTRQEIDSFNLAQQIDALRQVKALTEKLTVYRVRNDELEKKLKALEKKTNLIRNGIPKQYVVLAGILTFLILEFLLHIIVAIIACVIICSLYSSFYSAGNAGKREEMAQAEFNKMGPKYLSEQQQIMTDLEVIARSDEGYNAQLLLPDEFLFPEKVNALINILSSRNARNIIEAMDVYKANNN